MSHKPEDGHLPADSELEDNPVPDMRATGAIPKVKQPGSTSDIDMISTMMVQKADLGTETKSTTWKRQATKRKSESDKDEHYSEHSSASSGLSQQVSVVSEPIPSMALPKRTYAQVVAGNTPPKYSQQNNSACTTQQSNIRQITTPVTKACSFDPRLQVTMTKNVQRDQEFYAQQLDQAQKDMYNYQMSHQQNKARWQGATFSTPRQPDPIIPSSSTDIEETSQDEFYESVPLERTHSFRKTPRKLEMKPSKLDAIVQSRAISIAMPRLEVGTPNENNLEMRKETVLNKEEMLDTNLALLQILKSMNPDPNTAKLIEQQLQVIQKSNYDIELRKQQLEHTKKMASCYSPSITIPELYEYTDFNGYQTKELLQPRNLRAVCDTFDPDKQKDADFSVFWDKLLVHTRGHKLDERAYISILNILVQGSASKTIIDMIKANSSLEEILTTMNDLYSQSRTIINDIENLNSFKRKPNENIKKAMQRAKTLADKIKPMYNEHIWINFKQNEILKSIANQIISERTRNYIDSQQLQHWKNGTELSYISLLNEIENFETGHSELPQNEKGLLINVCTGSVKPKTCQKTDQLDGLIDENRNPKNKQMTSAINMIAKKIHSIIDMDQDSPIRKRRREDEDQTSKPTRPILKPIRRNQPKDNNVQQNNQNRLNQQKGPPQRMSQERTINTNDTRFNKPYQGRYIQQNRQYQNPSYNQGNQQNGTYRNYNSSNYRGYNTQRRGGPNNNYEQRNNYNQGYYNSYGQNRPQRYDYPVNQGYNYPNKKYYNQNGPKQWPYPPPPIPNGEQSPQKEVSKDNRPRCPDCTRLHNVMAFCPNLDGEKINKDYSKQHLN